jgi:hypothetical protein
VLPQKNKKKKKKKKKREVKIKLQDKELDGFKLIENQILDAMSS